MCRDPPDFTCIEILLRGELDRNLKGGGLVDLWVKEFKATNSRELKDYFVGLVYAALG